MYPAMLASGFLSHEAVTVAALTGVLQMSSPMTANARRAYPLRVPTGELPHRESVCIMERTTIVLMKD
jgi:hypothetical protein